MAELWFDVERKYNTTLKANFEYEMRCGLM